jgi:hypothetical protein
VQQHGIDPGLEDCCRREVRNSLRESHDCVGPCRG